MDMFRNLLIVGLLVVSYLLVLAWNEDYGQGTTDPSVSVSDTLGPLASDAAGLTVPEDGPGLATPESISTLPQEGTATTEAPTSAERALIRVSTDVLDVAIDPLGGQVVFAALPQYSVSLVDKRPLELLSTQGRYYVAETSLIGDSGPYTSSNGGTPLYQSSQPQYQMTENQEILEVVLTAERQGVHYDKIYRFSRSLYDIEVSYRIRNDSTATWKGNFAAKLERDRSGDPTQSSAFGAHSFLGAVLSTPGAPYEKLTFDDMLQAPVKVETDQGWIAFIQHYFLTAWVPAETQRRIYQTRAKDGRFIMGYVESQLVVAPGETGTVSSTLYIGPKIMESLEKIHPDLPLTVDFGWLWLIAKPLFLVLDFIHDYVGNWGVAIILLTIAIKAAFFHLSAASYRSMANMRRVAPELTRIRDLYGDDRQKMSQAMMELYRKEKINPLGGCLPILVQMPVFIALYWVLLESVELRQAPFFGWIQDLSIKDPYFILPLLMGATMFIQMKLNPTPPDPVQARVMQLMPVIFTVFFLWFPAGLVLYWFVNNLLSIAQQWVITRQIEAQAGSSR